MIELVEGSSPVVEPVWDVSAACGPAWSQYPPTGLLLDLLNHHLAADLDDEQLLEVAAAADALIAHAQALQVRALAAFAELRYSQGAEEREFAAEEVGLALGIGARSAENRLQLSTHLRVRLPGTFAALHAGEIDLAKARVIDDATINLSPAHACAVETAVLPKAAELSAHRLRAAVARAVLRIDPDGAHHRHQAARAGRRVELRPAEDGMAGLYALLPAEQALAIYQRIDQLARAQERDARSADERRADVFTGLLLGQPDEAPTTTTQVHLTLPLTTLAGMDQLPGELAGYGPITAAHARDLATTGGATWRRLLTDPVSGVVLDFGRTTYRPPAALADFIRARDRLCRFKNCGQPAYRCDLDHSRSWADGGTTCDTNLEALCRRHHRLKHDCPGWSLTQDDHGECTWTTPTGRQVKTTPAPAAEPATHRGPPGSQRGSAPPGGAPPGIEQGGEAPGEAPAQLPADDLEWAPF